MFILNSVYDVFCIGLSLSSCGEISNLSKRDTDLDLVLLSYDS